MPFTVPINEPQPSQLLVDADRLRGVLDWYDFDGHEYEPVSVIELGGELVITDGHTRAIVTLLAGCGTLLAARDPDRQSLDVDLYGDCVDWCRSASVRSVADLIGRVVSRERFLEDWVARCQAASGRDGD